MVRLDRTIGINTRGLGRQHDGESDGPVEPDHDVTWRESILKRIGITVPFCTKITKNAEHTEKNRDDALTRGA